MSFFKCISFISIVIVLLSCNGHNIIKVDRTLIIRDYYPNDSLMYDKLIFKEGNLYSWDAISGLNKMYISDSVLSRSNWEQFRIDIDKDNYIEILDTFKIVTHKHIFNACKYLIVSARSNRKLEDFGIYVHEIGTVYYRGYHSGRIINLYKAKSSNASWINPKSTKYIINFLKDSILFEPMPTINPEAIDEEIEGEIELDTISFY